MVTLTPEMLINMLNQDLAADPAHNDSIDEWLEKYPASPAIKLLVAKQQLRQTGQIDAQLWQQLLLEWQPVSQILIWENNGGSFIDRDETPDKVDLIVQQVSFDEEEDQVEEELETYIPGFAGFIWTNQDIVPTLEPDSEDKMSVEAQSSSEISLHKSPVWELPDLPLFIWTDKQIVPTWVESKELPFIFTVDNYIGHISFVFDISNEKIKSTLKKKKKDKSKQKSEGNTKGDAENQSATETIESIEHKASPKESNVTSETDAHASDFIKWLKKLPGAAEHQDSIIDMQMERKKDKKKKKSKKENKIRLKGLKKKNKEKKKKKKGKKNELEKIIQSSVEKKDDLVSETLALILAKQEHYSKAIEMYEKLILIYPEKSSYFAARIRELKKNI